MVYQNDFFIFSIFFMFSMPSLPWLLGQFLDIQLIWISLMYFDLPLILQNGAMGIWYWDMNIIIKNIKKAKELYLHLLF